MEQRQTGKIKLNFDGVGSLTIVDEAIRLLDLSFIFSDIIEINASERVLSKKMQVVDDNDFANLAGQISRNIEAAQECIDELWKRLHAATPTVKAGAI